MAELIRGAFLPPPVQYRVRPDPVQNRVNMHVTHQEVPWDEETLKNSFFRMVKSVNFG